MTNRTNHRRVETVNRERAAVRESEPQRGLQRHACRPRPPEAQDAGATRWEAEGAGRGHRVTSAPPVQAGPYGFAVNAMGLILATCALRMPRYCGAISMT